MPVELLSRRLRRWRGDRRQEVAADLLGIPPSTYRKYEYGKRTPNNLALAELERRMRAHPEPQPTICPP